MRERGGARTAAILAPVGQQMIAPQAAAQADMTAVERNVLAMENHPRVIRCHLALLAFAVTSGYSLTGTLKVGDRIDSHQWNINGNRLPQFHMISHRNLSDAAFGAAIPNATELHRQVDRMHAADFLYLCDRLRDVDTPQDYAEERWRAGL